MIACPLKPHFSCEATAKLIVESNCIGCPNAERLVFNNPQDGFGRAFGYQFPPLPQIPQKQPYARNLTHPFRDVCSEFHGAPCGNCNLGVKNMEIPHAETEEE